MKQIGGVTYIGVSLKDLKKYFTDDAVIHVSKKFLKSYEMISGIAEASKPISMKVVEKTDKIEEPVPMVEPEKEAAPPVELNISKGDW
jgi:hypothetical protein|tara:strand:- start:608 stop:871 length:264 start_codon:yes stop_codon:yes gene_type:complete